MDAELAKILKRFSPKVETCTPKWRTEHLVIEHYCSILVLPGKGGEQMQLDATNATMPEASTTKGG